MNEQFQQFLNSYIICALCLSSDDDLGYESLLNEGGYTIDDIAPSSLTILTADCQKFVNENFHLFNDNYSQAGYDFWLTRNGHGACFLDRDEEMYLDKEMLTANARKFKETDLYIGDDNLVYSL